MAKSKTDILAEGLADSQRGFAQCPYKPGSWQHTYWTTGWESGEDEKALAKQKVYDAAVNFDFRKKTVVAAPVNDTRRHVVDARRRCAAKIAAFERKRNLRRGLLQTAQMNKRSAHYG